MSADSIHSLTSSISDEVLDNVNANNNTANNYSTSNDLLGQVPQAYDPEDAQSQISADGAMSSTLSRASSLKMVRTETVKSMKSKGLQRQITQLDVNRPQAVANPIFPEEYTLETETGLVPVKTLHQIGRTQTNTSRVLVPSSASMRRGSIASRKTRRSRANTKTDHSDSSSSIEKTEKDDEENRSGGRVGGGEEGEGEEGEETELDHESLMQEIGLDPEIELVTFTINDPANPHNWPSWQRWLYTIVLSLLVVCVAFGSSVVTGGLGLMKDKYHVSMEVSILSCSLMVLGFSVGPLIWSPLSEQIGRRPVYFISFLLYFIFNIPCAVAPNIGTILVCRFLCGVFSASGLANVGGSISDMFPTETRGKAIAYFAAAPYGGPVVGPLVAGFISRYYGKLSMLFWDNFAFSGFMWIIVSLIPETYAPVILKKKAKLLRKETDQSCLP
ncbi:unnamed protein product [Ambrosiozyma monospora]|uniref:Unnamed protein product n=1 Tax=Ambrosiozyma monospora TaxID=43982 RepID=A0A9W6YW84_AMBMO|nr:unnamed protein product [Ambrosiozyma monospora]